MGVKNCAVKDLKHDRGQQRTRTNKRSALTARAVRERITRREFSILKVRAKGEKEREVWRSFVQTHRGEVVSSTGFSAVLASQQHIL